MSNILKKKSLGRGLNKLLSEASLAVMGVEEYQTDGEPSGELSLINIQQLEAGKYQPRKDFPEEGLQELAESIRSQGVIQPILVRPIGGTNRFEIIAGERRTRAAKLAGLERIPAIIREIPDQSAMAVALVENLQREDLNPIDEAQGLARLITEFEVTHQELGSMIGKSRTSITNTLRLLQLHEEVQNHVREGRLEMGHARPLLGLEPHLQRLGALKVINNHLSVRDTELLVKKLQNPASPQTQKPGSSDPNITALERQLGDKLGTKVSIQHNASGQGKLVIHYHNLDGLEGILEKIR